MPAITATWFDKSLINSPRHVGGQSGARSFVNVDGTCVCMVQGFRLDMFIYCKTKVIDKEYFSNECVSSRFARLSR